MGSIYVTGLGKVSAWLYFSPWDVYAWFKNFSRLFGYHNKAPDVEIDDLTLAWAVGDIPSNDIGYVPKDIAEEFEELRWKLSCRGIKASNGAITAVAILNCLSGKDYDDEIGAVKAMRRGIVFDIDRIINALSLIDGMYAKWNKEGLWKTLAMRIKYGIGPELLDLVRIPGIGGKRAKKLYEKGFKSVKDVAEGNKKELATLFPLNFVMNIQKAAQELGKED